MKILRLFMHYLRRLVIMILKFLIGFIPKDNKKILFSAWFGKKYADSSMYMYEYMRDNTNYNVYWYTREKNIYYQLKKEGKNVVLASSFKGIWYQIRAIMLVSSVQFADFSPYFLKNCIYFDLDHGFPIKQSGFEQPDTSERFISYQLLLRKGIDYYMSASSDFVKGIISNSFRIDSDHIVKCNKPRTDILFDSDMRKGKNIKIDLLKKQHKKIISYLPTQRSCGKVAIHITQIMDLDKIQKLCEEHDAIFIIKKHFYHRDEIEMLDKYPNIIDMTQEDIETQTLLYQSDVLISDYSACYIDYLLLDRPIILYAYDYKDYLKSERDLYLKFEENNCGYKAFDREQFNLALSSVCDDWKDEKHVMGRKMIRAKYFSDDVAVGNAREAISSIITQLINNEYKANWKK